MKANAKAKLIYFLSHNKEDENKFIAVVPARYSRARTIAVIQSETEDWDNFPSLTKKFDYRPSDDGSFVLVPLDDKGIIIDDVDGVFVVEPINMIGFKGDVR